MLTQSEKLQKPKPRVSLWRHGAVLFGLAFPLSAHMILPDSENQLVSAVLLTIVALIFWSTHLAPIGYVSALIFVFSIFLGLLPFGSIWPTISSPPIVIILAGFVLAEAVRVTGLALFVADRVLHRSRSSREVALKMAFYELLGAFVIPNVAVRVALMIPILSALSVSPKTRKLLIIDAALTSILTGSMTVMSSSSAISSDAIVHHLLNVNWDFFQWLYIFGPIIFLIWGVSQLMIISKIPAEPNRLWNSRPSVKLNLPQRRTMHTLTLMLLGWIVGPAVGISLAYVSVAGVVLLIMPHFGVMTPYGAVKTLRLDLVAFYVVSLSLPLILTDSGVARFVTKMMTANLHLQSTVIIFFGLAVTVIIMRLLFANSVTLTAIFLPILISLESKWHVNVLVASVILISAGSFGFLLPVQSPAGVIAAEFGEISNREFLKVGVPVAFCGLIFIILAALTYWPSVV